MDGTDVPFVIVYSPDLRGLGIGSGYRDDTVDMVGAGVENRW